MFEVDRMELNSVVGKGSWFYKWNRINIEMWLHIPVPVIKGFILSKGYYVCQKCSGHIPIGSARHCRGCGGVFHRICVTNLPEMDTKEETEHWRCPTCDTVWYTPGPPPPLPSPAAPTQWVFWKILITAHTADLGYMSLSLFLGCRLGLEEDRSAQLVADNYTAAVNTVEKQWVGMTDSVKDAEGPILSLPAK